MAPLISLIFLAYALFAAADYTVTIQASSNRGIWEGWGTSLAWWAVRFGDRDDLANIFFTLNSTQWMSQTLPGLGFNIARYNAGACSRNSIDGESMAVSPNMYKSRQVEGFWLDWDSSDPSSSSWDWSVDAKQRAMMQKAAARGANRFELFSNSPMWWMCYNHKPAGANDGSKDNLQSWNYNQHATYLATIAKYAKDHWGIRFESVEPFNEPMASWWSSTGTQEGCHFDVSTQATIIGLLRSELDSRGLSNMMIASSDETSYDQAVSTWRALGSAALAKVDRINVHGYQKGEGRRDVLYDLVSGQGAKLWNSEYGENDATGEQLVRNLMLDFRWLQPTAWVYWQVLDRNSWGLLDADNEGGTIGNLSQKYFALAQFTRHIREGMRILDSGVGNVIPAYDATAHRLVIVAVNWDASQNIAFDLSQLSSRPANGATVRHWTTQVRRGDRYVGRADAAISGNGFRFMAATGVIHTFEIDGIYL